MNLQCRHPSIPLRVLVVNPLSPASQLVVMKIMSGAVFGDHQLIDLSLLVYSNEVAAAEVFKLELESCAFCCYNTIEITSDLPGVSDADVFLFITNFADPNKYDLNKIDTDEQFDTLYLLVKVANNFQNIPPPPKPSEEKLVSLKKWKKPEIKPRKPIFMADGIIALDILHSISKDMPSDVFFCPTPLPDIAKSVLGDHLKVRCDSINDTFVWGANDEVFHVELEKPMIVQDTVNGSRCDWNMIGQHLLTSLEMDSTQFSPSWMKKQFIHKVGLASSKNPHGCIHRASGFAKALKAIWSTRSEENGKTFYGNFGVISDGSLETIKGYPYVLPLVISGDSWSVNKRFEEELHLKQEIKRINKVVKEHHQQLISYCKKFLELNVIKQAFIPKNQSSISVVEENSTSQSSSSVSSSLHHLLKRQMYHISSPLSAKINNTKTCENIVGRFVGSRDSVEWPKLVPEH